MRKRVKNTVTSKINPRYKIHMLAKYKCVYCGNSFILSEKQTDEALKEDPYKIRCPYCQCLDFEKVAAMIDYDRLSELGCMGIGHVEEGEGLE